MMKVKVEPRGRLPLPQEYRDALGLREGDEVVLTLEAGELHVRTPRRTPEQVREAVERARERVRRYVSAERSLADELIAERRREAAGE